MTNPPWSVFYQKGLSKKAQSYKIDRERLFHSIATHRINGGFIVYFEFKGRQPRSFSMFSPDRALREGKHEKITGPMDGGPGPYDRVRTKEYGTKRVEQ